MGEACAKLGPQAPVRVVPNTTDASKTLKEITLMQRIVLYKKQVLIPDIFLKNPTNLKAELVVSTFLQAC